MKSKFNKFDDSCWMLAEWTDLQLKGLKFEYPCFHFQFGLRVVKWLHFCSLDSSGSPIYWLRAGHLGLGPNGQCYYVFIYFSERCGFKSNQNKKVNTKT